MGSRDSRSKERSIGIVCLLVFSVFSFCWLFFLQGHLIGRAYESMIIAHNGIQGNYNRLLMAVLGTMLLDTIALSSRAIIRNKGFMYAVDYAIPALLLGAFTGYDGQNMLSQTATAWIVSSVILILMFLTALAIKSYRLMHAGNIKPVFAMNLLLMTLALSVTAILGNTDETLHRKLLMERCLEQSKSVAFTVIVSLLAKRYAVSLTMAKTSGRMRSSSVSYVSSTRLSSLSISS